MNIDWVDLFSELARISYKTKLERSLKNSLKKFSKEELVKDIFAAIAYFNSFTIDARSPIIYRVKSPQSCLLKYDKFYPDKQVEKTFNDILGIRIVVSSYDIINNISDSKFVKVADMRKGKANDDGYRGVHLYFQKNHFYYPIEIQILTKHDKQFSEWMHLYTYKYLTDNEIGCKLRQMYEDEIIKTEDDFRKELRHVLHNSKRFQ